MKKSYVIIGGLFLAVCIIWGYCWLNRPVVSVVMLTYKRADLVGRAIESILGQTYKDFEFIILNDASSDNTDEIIAKYKDKRIRYYKNDTNKGIAYSRNRITKLARGKYIMIMDDDDVSLPERMELQVKFLEENPDIDVVAGQVIDALRIPLTHDEIASSLIQLNNIGNPNIMYRRNFIVKNKIEYASINFGEDWHFWLQMLFNGAKFGSINEDVLYRFAVSDKFYVVNKDDEKFIKDYIGKFFNPQNGSVFYEADGCHKLKMIKPKKILSDEFINVLIDINCK